MSEQPEQSEEAGLLPSQDLEPSKEDDAHGHFRQVSRAQALRRTRRLPDLLSPPPSSSLAHHLHPVRGHGFQPLGDFVFTAATYFVTFISATFDHEQ